MTTSTMKPMATPTSWQKALRVSRLPRPASDKPAPADQRDAPAGRIDDHPSAPLRQAHEDLKRGVQDTDRGPEADRTYKKLKRPA